MSSTFTFGITEIVDSPILRGVSYMRHYVFVVSYRLVEVEVASGHTRLESLVENFYSHSTFPLAIPRTFSRKVLWIEYDDINLILSILSSRPLYF